MDSQTSRKIIVAGVMAAVVGIGTVTFALRSPPVTPVAQIPQPTTPVTRIPAAALREAEIPAAPPPVAQSPDIPAAVAQLPDTPAPVAHHDGVGNSSTDAATPSTVERKAARKQHLAKADTSAVTNGTVAPTGPAAVAAEKPTTETVTNSLDRVMSADELTMPSAVSGSAADEQKAGTSTEFADSDSQSEVPQPH
jgi:hypothetical protein